MTELTCQSRGVTRGVLDAPQEACARNCPLRVFRGASNG